MTETNTSADTEEATVDHVADPPTGNGHGSYPVQEEMLPIEVPEYRGRPAVGMKSSVTGAGNRITRPHEIGDRTVLLVEVKLRGAGHEDTDDGIVYAERYKVVDLFELPRDLGHQLLADCRKAYRKSEDVPASKPGKKVRVDGSGTVVTDAEAAAMRGDGDEGEWACLDCGADRDPDRDGGPEPHREGCPDFGVDARDDQAAAAELEQARTEPWGGYETASRSTVLNRIAEFDNVEALAHVERYERAHKNRKTVLDAVAGRLAKLETA